MTNAEKQEIIEAVLAALATNSKTIAQLSPKQSLEDSDQFEVAGGSRVTYLVLKNGIREGLALESQLSDYVTGEDAMMYLAKLDTETGTIDFKESPCVMLDGFKDVNGYSPATGDLFYENRSGYQIWTKVQGGATGEHANTHVAYINRNENAIYRWTGTTMERIGSCEVVNDLVTGGTEIALSAEMGKGLKEKIRQVQDNVERLFNNLANMAFWDAAAKLSATPIPLDWSAPKKTVTLALTLSNAVVKYNGQEVSSSVQVDEGSGLTLTVEPASGHSLTGAPTVSTGATVTDLGNGTYSVSIASVDADMTLSISATGAAARSVTLHLAGCTKTSGPTLIINGGGGTFTFAEDTNFNFQSIQPSVEGADVVSWDSTTGELVIDDVDGEVTITVICIVDYEFRPGMFASTLNKLFSNVKRAGIFVDSTKIDNANTWADSNVQNSSQYSMMPIPAYATTIELSLTNSSYILAGMVFDGSVEAEDPGWQGQHQTIDLTEVNNPSYIAINFKKDPETNFSSADTLSTMGFSISIS